MNETERIRKHRRSKVNAVLVTALLLLLSCPLAVAQEARSLRVRLGDVEARVPAMAHDDGEIVSVRTLASALGLSVDQLDDASLRLRSRSKELVFPTGLPSMVRTPQGYLSLGADVIRRGGDLFVPAASVGRLLGALEPAGSARDKGSSEMRVSLVGAGPGKLKLSVDLPRVPEELRYEKSARGTWIVSFRSARRIEVPWRERELGHDLIERIRIHPGDQNRLILEIEPGPGLEALSAQRREDPPGLDLRLVAKAPGAKSSAALRVRGAEHVRRVVLDPGHGGSEDGAIGAGGLKEKDLVLDVARMVAARLRAEGFEVTLTRDGDEDLSLDDRAAVANRLRADLFVSIHANASRFSHARGAETYFLAREATDDKARTTAALENNAAGAAPESGAGRNLSLILWDLAQVEYLEDSALLAETIQAEFNRVLSIPDRGVRQAPFRVLVGATCASVLVELGFLTNREEARLLESSAYRQKLATALSDAIRRFRDAGDSHWTPAFEIGR